MTSCAHESARHRCVNSRYYVHVHAATDTATATATNPYPWILLEQKLVDALELFLAPTEKARHGLDAYCRPRTQRTPLPHPYPVLAGAVHALDHEHGRSALAQGNEVPQLDFHGFDVQIR